MARFRSETLRLIDSFQQRIDTLLNEIDFICEHCPTPDSRLIPSFCSQEKCSKTCNLFKTIDTLEADQAKLLQFI